MVFLELRRDSRVTTGNSGCLLCWPRQVQPSVRVAKESWGLLSSDCRANRPHLGLCPEANVPLQGRQGSRGCIPDASGETGIHLEWKQFATPWTAAHQASLSITNSQSLLKLMSIKSVMPLNHLVLCVPFSSCLQSFLTSGSFQRSQFFASSGQSIGASALASVLPMNIQSWFHLGLTSLISLWEKAMASHSISLAGKIPWTEEPGRLQSMGSHGVRHD